MGEGSGSFGLLTRGTHELGFWRACARNGSESKFSSDLQNFRPAHLRSFEVSICDELGLASGIEKRWWLVFAEEAAAGFVVAWGFRADGCYVRDAVRILRD